MQIKPNESAGSSAGKTVFGRRAGGRMWRRGSSVLEMSLCIGVLLYLSMGMIEFGYAYYVKGVLQGAAREGARAAVVPGATNTAVNTAVSNYIACTGLSASSYTVTTTPTDISTSATGNAITVTVPVVWGTVANGCRPMAMMPATKVISGSVTMRDEG